MMHTETQILKSMDLFMDLKPDELEKVASLMHPTRVTEGEILSEIGRPAYNFYVVLSGNYLLSFDDGRAVTLHEAGDVIGWATLAGGATYIGTGTALTNGEVLTMKSEDFLQLLQGESELGDKLMQKNRELQKKMMPFANL